jgi:hypothetical protein
MVCCASFAEERRFEIIQCSIRSFLYSVLSSLAEQSSLKGAHPLF